MALLNNIAEKKIEESVEAAGDGVDDPGLTVALSGNLRETPRTKEALKRCGVLASELKIKSFQDFHRPTDSLEKQRLRYNHYETRRQAKLSLVLQERAKVFVELTKKQTQNQGNTKSYQSMNMLEQLLDQEAGRLEGELKQQLRYHTVVENENKEQLEREAALKDKNKKRIEKVDLVKEEQAARVRVHAAASGARMDHSRKILKDIKHEHESKCANFLSHVLETEVRIREFRNSLEGRNFEKSEKWRTKVESIHSNFDKIQVDKRQSGELQLERKAEKTFALEHRRKKEREEVDMELAKKSLRVVDVLDKKHRIERQRDAKKDQIREEMFHSHSRIHTLLALKDQIVKQRKARIFQQSSLKGRALNIKNIPTGPGQYDIDRDAVLHEIPVPKMPAISKHSSEPSLLLSAQVPPPGAYDPTILPTGNRVDTCVNKSVLFTKGSVPNFIESIVRTYRDNPGPGTYKHGGLDLSAGTIVLKPPMVRAQNASNHFSAPAWAEDYAKTPGPAAYITDKFLRDEEAAKKMQNMPNLGRAIQLSK